MELTLLALLAVPLLCGAMAEAAPAKGEWPLPGHDGQYHAQAELPCRMPQAPKEAWSYDAGHLPAAQAVCADVDGDGQEEVLCGSSPLVCVSLSGREKWRSNCGSVVGIADVDGDGRTEVVVLKSDDYGSPPQILDGRTGEVLWTRPGPGYLGTGRTLVEKLLPATRGVQLACVWPTTTPVGKRAQVWSFTDGFVSARLEWEREFNKDHPVTDLCLSAAGPYGEDGTCVLCPVIGGLVALDPRDGSDLFRVYWEALPGEPNKRNYGATYIQDLDGDGEPEFALLNSVFVLQIAVFAPGKGGTGARPDAPVPSPPVGMGELASYAEGPILWRRCWGDVYPLYGGRHKLAVPRESIADVDGDGKPEIVVSVGESGREPNTWNLTIYDAMTGEEKLTVPGLYARCVLDLDGDGVAEVLATEEQALAPRGGGALVVGAAAGGRWRERGRIENGRIVAGPSLQPPAAPGGSGTEPPPLVWERDGRKAMVIVQGPGAGRQRGVPALLSLKPGEPVTLTPLPGKVAAGARLLAASRKALIGSTPDGRMHALDGRGRVTASWRGCGTAAFTNAVVADLDADGLNEMVVCRAGGQVACVRGPREGARAAEELWRIDGRELWHTRDIQNPAHGPTALIADMNGGGKKEVLVACDVNGISGVKFVDCRGKTVWQVELAGKPSGQVITKAAVADLSGGGHLDVYVAAYLPAPAGGSNGQAVALDGRDGSVLWRNDGWDPAVSHHEMVPYGMPTVCDVNGDGCDDVLFMARNLLIALNGKDGSFLHEPAMVNSIFGSEGVLWSVSCTQIPVDVNGDGKLGILLANSTGNWGAWTLDRQPLWHWAPDSREQAPRHPGIGDVDGDGRLEFGVIHDTDSFGNLKGGIFRCYDLATGALKWELRGIRQTTDVVTADVDGDGRPEFVAGLIAIKAVDQHHGKVLWEMPLPFETRSPVVADVDGDGRCEIILGCSDGRVRVYK